MLFLIFITDSSGETLFRQREEIIHPAEDFDAIKNCRN